MIRNFMTLISGLLFGLGLGISEMINPQKVLNFLDVSGNWDPSLLFVLGAGLAVTLLSFRVILRMDKPLLSSEFSFPANTQIDIKLIIGAILFGIGWGLVGYCPGPAIASLVYGQMESLIFLTALFLGFNIHHLYRRPITIV